MDEIGVGGSHEYHHNHIETPQLAQPKQEIAIAPMVRQDTCAWYLSYLIFCKLTERIWKPYENCVPRTILTTIKTMCYNNHLP